MTYEERYAEMIGLIHRQCPAFKVEQIRLPQCLSAIYVEGTYRGLEREIVLQKTSTGPFVAIRMPQSSLDGSTTVSPDTEIEDVVNTLVWYVQHVIPKTDVVEVYDRTELLLLEEAIQIMDGVVPEWIKY